VGILNSAGDLDKIIDAFDLSKFILDKKQKKTIRAVDGISFQVKRGEIFGFLGPNGAGKTTTMRLIAGFLKPSGGSIFVDGFDPWENPAQVHANLGILTEDHGNYEDLTLKENLEFFGGFYKIRNITARIDEILDLLKLRNYFTTRVGKLSKGMKQRAALARAFLHDPQLLLLDEPTTGLDPESAMEIRDYIKKLKQRDRTIIICSHNLEEVQKLCDRVAILHQGKIRLLGNVEDLSRGIWRMQEIRCQLRKPIPERLIDKVELLKGVEEAHLNGDTIVIQGLNLDQDTPLIVRFLVECGCQVLTVKRTRHSLEEIYLRMMEDIELDKEMQHDPILKMAEEEGDGA
jgi:ABC-2 type transport system ATP-binding protein